MRALTLTQPWAETVVVGLKRVETRSWPAPASAKGELAIHAGKGWTKEDQRFAARLWEEDWVKRAPHELPRGEIVAVARLVGCRRTEEVRDRLDRKERFLGIYGDGRWAWMLADVRVLAVPVPCKGALGLWHVPADVEALVRAQLAGA
ncbi:MAG: ASCH domain-containing protein [Dehalococcoidia bacterium]